MSTIDADTYAILLARVARRGRTQLAEILAELGFTFDDLRRDEPAVLEELAGAWPRRMGKTAMRFATALAGEIEAVGPLASDAPPTRAPAPAPAPEKAIPSFLQAAPLPAAARLPAPPAPRPEPPQTPPVVARPPAHLTGTADTDLSAIVAAVQRNAIPFNPSARSTLATPEATPAATPEARPAPRRAASGTAVLPAMGDEIDLQRYPLELYAAITGAIARGEPRDQVLAGHAVAPELFDRIAKAWGARFTAEPQLLARFQELVRSKAAGGRS